MLQGVNYENLTLVLIKIDIFAVKMVKDITFNTNIHSFTPETHKIKKFYIYISGVRRGLNYIGLLTWWRGTSVPADDHQAILNKANKHAKNTSEDNDMKAQQKHCLIEEWL